MLSLLLALAPIACAERVEVGLSARAAKVQDQPFDHTHARWSAVLGRFLHGNRLDYEALGRERGELDLYLLELHAVTREDFATWTREQRFAFWIDAYNAFAVQLVLAHYPVASIRDIGTLLSPVWKKEFVPLGHLYGAGTTDLISLDTIEHKILRPEFEDARVHAAINCASESCPPLAPEAFRADALDAQLDARVLAWLSDTALNRFDAASRRADVSSIFEWFESDFARDAGSVQAWIAQHGPESARWMAEGEVDLHHLEYSWKLNDVPREKR